MFISLNTAITVLANTVCENLLAEEQKLLHLEAGGCDVHPVWQQAWAKNQAALRRFGR